MLPFFALEHRKLCPTQRLSAAKALFKPSVIRSHNFARGAITDRPKTHHQTFRSRQKESSAQPVHAFAILHFADASLASRERDEFRPPEIQAGRFERGQNPIIISAAIQVRACERKP